MPRAERGGWAYPLSPSRLAPIEPVAGAAILALIAWLVYGSYIGAGGFHSDDWAIAAHYRFEEAPRFWNTVGAIRETLGARPLLALFLAVPHALFGLDESLHIGLAVGLGALASLLFYVVLRQLRFAPLHAAVPAVLAFLFPWSDSMRFWATAGVNYTAICLFLLGVVLALAGLEVGGRRGIALHVAAVTLYVASVLTYEIAAAAALLVGLLYLTRAPWSRVRPRWAADVVGVAGATAYSAAATLGVRYVPPLPYKVKVIPGDTCEVMSIVASSLLPRSASSPWAQLAVVAALVGGVALSARSGLARVDVRAWLAVAAFAAVWTAVAYAITIGALSPLHFGTGNRGNAFAALPLALLLYALVMILAVGLARGSLPRRLAPALALAVMMLVAVGYVDRLKRDERLWLDAHRRQQQILTAFAQQPRPPSGSFLYTFGTATRTAPGIPIFAYGWDLQGALRLMWHERSLDSLPLEKGSRLVCGDQRVFPSGNGLGPGDGVAYGSVFLVDPTAGQWLPLRTQTECRAALAAFRPAPGPLVPVPENCPLRRLAVGTPNELS